MCIIYTSFLYTKRRGLIVNNTLSTEHTLGPHAQELCELLRSLGSSIHEIPELGLQGKDGASLAVSVSSLSSVAESHHDFESEVFERHCSNAVKRLRQK